MENSIEIQINKYEEKLQTAMMKSDTMVLDELLAPDLIFTNHLGQIFTKQDDLHAHQSGIVKINKIVPGEQQTRIIGNAAVVSVRVMIAGSIAGEYSESNFRFTRVWVQRSDKTWQVIAAHSSIII